MLKQVIGGLERHLVDSTAIVAVTTPVFGALEKFSGMSNELSIEARKLGAYITYAGFGYAAAGGRELWRYLFSVDDKTDKRTQNIHDHIYFGLLSLATSPFFYLFSGILSGERDKKIGLGIAIATGIGFIGGGRMGYFIDCYRDLIGIKQTARLPKILQNRKPRVKWAIAAILTAGALAASAGMYALSSSNGSNISQVEASAGYNG